MLHYDTTVYVFELMYHDIQHMYASQLLLSGTATVVLRNPGARTMSHHLIRSTRTRIR
jgi:hypothetical protein